MRTYLEIGTCDFDTLNEKFAGREGWRGVSVEAVPEYFGRLRKLDKNRYVNAVCSAGGSTRCDFHYVPPDVIAKNGLPDWLKGCGSTDKNQPSLVQYAQHVVTKTLDTVLLEDVLNTDIFHSSGRRRIDLLKTDTEGHDWELVTAALQVCRPTNIIFVTRFMTPREFLTLDENLLRRGYRYRGRGGDSVQYSLPSVLMVVDENWSTGSIARDLRHVSGHWHVDRIGWDRYPDDLELQIAEHDAVVAFCLLSPTAWAPLQQHGVVCCGAVELEMLAQRGQQVLGGCLGAVSKDAYFQLTKLPTGRSVYYTPASARLSRFTRRPGRPIKTLGWCGVPRSAGNFGTDAKRFAMFEEIVKEAGLSCVVSNKDYTYDTMQEFYDKVDLLVCTSSTEGGPLPLFEAIACGVPVISTDVGLAKEAEEIGKFETAQQAVGLINGLADERLRKEYTEKQWRRMTLTMSMENLCSYWDEFFEACARLNTRRALMF